MLDVAISKGHVASEVVSAGGPIPPGPIAGRVNSDAAIIDTVLFFIPEDAGPRGSGMNDVGFLFGYFNKKAGVAIHPGIAHAIASETKDGRVANR